MTMIFCFFKQKTAYEVRISDWSSDVCSSDLGQANNVTLPSFSALAANGPGPNFLGVDDEDAALRTIFKSGPNRESVTLSEARPVAVDTTRRRITVGISQERPGERDAFGPFTGTYRYDLVGDRVSIDVGPCEDWDPRSEEHTSELPSLMSIPYAAL